MTVELLLHCTEFVTLALMRACSRCWVRGAVATAGGMSVTGQRGAGLWDAGEWAVADGGNGSGYRALLRPFRLRRPLRSLAERAGTARPGRPPPRRRRLRRGRR